MTSSTARPRTPSSAGSCAVAAAVPVDRSGSPTAPAPAVPVAAPGWPTAAAREGRLESAAAIVAVEGELDQAIEELRVGQAARFPEARRHGDLGEGAEGGCLGQKE